MKKEIRVIDQSRGVVQITCQDERYYSISEVDKSTGLPIYKFIPSVTWISSYYPKGIAFYKWLANKGWDEAEAIKIAAGSRGSKVHQVTDILEQGGVFEISQLITTPDGEQSELDAEELQAVLSFSDWHNETKPDCLLSEAVVFGDGYAGTVDRIYRINGEIWIIDLKTSANIWPEMELQVSAYSHATINYKDYGITNKEWEARKLGILQLGYRLNKRGWKLTEIGDKYHLFKMAQAIWENENPNDKPKQINIPLKIELKTKGKQDGN